MAFATCGAEGGGCGSLVIGDGTGGSSGATGGGAQGGGTGTVTGTAGAAGGGGTLCDSTWSRDFADVASVIDIHLAKGPSQELVLVGTTGASIDLGGGALSPLGSSDIVIARFDCDGAPIWSRRFGPGGIQEVGAVAVDRYDHIFLAGSYQGTADFVGGSLPESPEPTAFLVELDQYGNYMWGKRLGDGLAIALAVDSADNVAVAGYSLGTVDLGAGPIPLSDGAFVAKYRPQGDYVFGKAVDHARFLSLDFVTDDALVVVGDIEATVDLGTGPMAPVGGRDMLVAKFDSTGAPQWAKTHGTPLQDSAERVVAGSNGVFVAGYSEGALDLGGGALPFGGMYLAKLGLDGQLLWNAGKLGQGDANPLALSVGSDGNVYVAGAFRPMEGFGGCVQTSEGVAGFLVGLDTQAGTPAVCRLYGGTSYGEEASIQSIATYGLGKLAVAGSLVGKMDLGSGTMASKAMPGTDRWDLFLGVVHP
jgi:hypothetical protein